VPHSPRLLARVAPGLAPRVAAPGRWASTVVSGGSFLARRSLPSAAPSVVWAAGRRPLPAPAKPWRAAADLPAARGPGRCGSLGCRASGRRPRFAASCVGGRARSKCASGGIFFKTSPPTTRLSVVLVVAVDGYQGPGRWRRPLRSACRQGRWSQELRPPSRHHAGGACRQPPPQASLRSPPATWHASGLRKGSAPRLPAPCPRSPEAPSRHRASRPQGPGNAQDRRIGSPS